jgi:hypothetical protein
LALLRGVPGIDKGISGGLVRTMPSANIGHSVTCLGQASDGAGLPIGQGEKLAVDAVGLFKFRLQAEVLVVRVLEFPLPENQ